MTKDVRLLCHTARLSPLNAPPVALLYHVLVQNKVLQFVCKHQLVKAGDRIGIAVSGGADSVALLRVLLDLRAALGCVLSVVHLHHGLRGADADADAEFVQHLAAEHSLEFHLAHRDIATFAADQKLSIEAAGRRARLEYFAELQSQGLIDKVATAHTANDQAETVLMKFLRGSGTRGLAGIYPKSDNSGAAVIRPLLDTTRAEIETYLRERNQPWREDATNKSAQFLRNRVRHDLLPKLQQDFNPAILHALSISAEIARDEQEFWDATVAKTLADLAAPNQSVDTAAFQALPTALQRRVLIAVANLPLDFDHIERAREFLIANSSGEREIARGMRIRCVRNSAGRSSFTFIADSQPSKAQGSYSVSLTLPGSIDVPAPRSSRLVAKLVSTSNVTSGRALDPSLSGRTLTIRNWQAGDRYQPFGRGEGKLKDFFQESHIPAAERTSWPVAELDGEIVWVSSLPVAARFAAQGTSAMFIEEVSNSRLPEVVTSQEASRRRK